MKTFFKFKKNLFEIFDNKIFLIIFFSFFFLISMHLCYWQGIYNNDPLHWGFMLKNALDFNKGYIPYKDIFIQYGILTTLVHAFSLKIYENISSIIIITNLFYFFSIFFIFLIAYEISKEILKAILIFLVNFLFFPFAIYPWSLYILSPFLMAGIYLFIKYYNKKKILFSGVVLGISCLGRETVFFPIFFSFIFFELTNYFIFKKKIQFQNIFLFLIGFFIPIIFFILYLIKNNLINFWYIDSWLYINKFMKFIHTNPHWGSPNNIIKSILSPFKFALVDFDFRWLFVVLTFSINCYNLLLIFLKKKEYNLKYLYIYYLSISLLFCCYSIIGFELFRISTTSILCTVLLLLFFKNKLEKYFYIYIVFFIVAISLTGNSGNYFLVSKNQKDRSVTVNKPNIFKDKKWNKENVDYYLNLEKELKIISDMKCNIKYEINYTLDNFIASISPFRKWQLAPFYNYDFLNKLRIDLDPDIKIKAAKDTVIYSVATNENLEKNEYENFFIYKIIKIPYALFIPNDTYLKIYLPQICK